MANPPKTVEEILALQPGSKDIEVTPEGIRDAAANKGIYSSFQSFKNVSKKLFDEIVHGTKTQEKNEKVQDTKSGLILETMNTDAIDKAPDKSEDNELVNKENDNDGR